VIEANFIKETTKRLIPATPITALLIVATTVVAAGTITTAFAEECPYSQSGYYHHHHHHHHWNSQGNFVDASGGYNGYDNNGYDNNYDSYDSSSDCPNRDY
jgi:hypothetical protein